MMADSTHHSRRAALTWAAAGVLATTAGLPALVRAAASADRRAALPNILFIMADDLGYADLSCYGRRDYETPAIDSLARDGLQLMQGYANSPVCSPTRVALITGRYQYRLPVGLVEPIGFDPAVGLDPAEVTMPGHFRQIGYQTSLIGKWHLGPLPNFGPLKSGYDRFFGVYEGGTDYFTHQLVINQQVMGSLYEGETPIVRDGYLTDLLATRAVAEIDAARQVGRPFFISLHFTAPHWPWQGPGDKGVAGGESMNWDGGNIAIYADMMRSLDANVGRVLAHLARAGLAQDTIVVFTSDNGGERFSDGWPFIGGKTELLEGGLRVPLLVRWPGRVPAGQRSEQTMLSMDFLPTLLAATGRPAPALALDGENLLDQLTGRAPVRDRRLFWRYGARDQKAVRDGDWKYLSISGREFLFNLGEDQRERADLSGRAPQRLAELSRAFAAWNETMLAYPVPPLSYDTAPHLADRQVAPAARPPAPRQ